MTEAAITCPDGKFCDGMEVWRYADPITDETRWSWVCLGLRETFNHATLPLALAAMRGGLMTSEIEPRPAGSYRTPDTVTQELADLARLIDRADAEASRLRARRLVAWRAARDAGLSWRAIAAASGGMDHAGIAKTVNGLRKGTD